MVYLALVVDGLRLSGFFVTWVYLFLKGQWLLIWITGVTMWFLGVISISILTKAR